MSYLPPGWTQDKIEERLRFQRERGDRKCMICGTWFTDKDKDESLCPDCQEDGE